MPSRRLPSRCCRRGRLIGHADPAITEPIVAQANVDMEGRPVRVQVTAATTREAIDLLEARLLERFERMVRNWEALRGHRPVPGPHEWRHAAPRSPPADGVGRRPFAV